GLRFGKGPLYWLLRNPVYVGRVSHKGKVYEGRQAPIVDLAIWDKVQELLSAKSAGREKRRVMLGGRPLMGRLFDDRGNAMSPSYTKKPSGKRYTYYVSQALLQNDKARAGAVSRVQAEEIERVVSKAMDNAHCGGANDQQIQWPERVVVHKDRIEIVRVPADEEDSATVVVPVNLNHRNRAKVLDDGSARPDPTIVRALIRAHQWRGWLEQDEARSYRDVARRAEVDATYVQLLLPLAF